MVCCFYYFLLFLILCPNRNFQYSQLFLLCNIHQQLFYKLNIAHAHAPKQFWIIVRSKGKILCLYLFPQLKKIFLQTHKPDSVSLTKGSAKVSKSPYLYLANFSIIYLVPKSPMGSCCLPAEELKRAAFLLLRHIWHCNTQGLPEFIITNKFCALNLSFDKSATHFHHRLCFATKSCYFLWHFPVATITDRFSTR